jgi:hypothetical protein
MTHVTGDMYRIEKRVCFMWGLYDHVYADSFEEAKIKFDEWLTNKKFVVYGEVK